MSREFHLEKPNFEDPTMVKWYEDNLYIVAEEAHAGDQVWVVSGDEAHLFAGYFPSRDARLCAELLKRGCSISLVEADELYVPVSVASQGQAAIAAYLRSIKGFPQRTIAEELDVKTVTIHRYLSDFAQGNR